MAASARRAGLNVSALTQDALRQALAVHETNDWLAALAQGSASDVAHESALDALDAARDESGTHHA